jgi:hypothetical protein
MALAALLEPGIVTAIRDGIVILPSANAPPRRDPGDQVNPYIGRRARSGRRSHAFSRSTSCPTLAPIVVMASIVMGFAIIVEASLSFLGLGVQPPTTSWGQSLNAGRTFMEDAPGWFGAGAGDHGRRDGIQPAGDALRDA